MGVYKYPNRRMYWGQSIYVPFISEAMNRNRFEEILSILHSNDNSKNKPPSDPAFNKLFKIQPLIDHFQKVFSQSLIPETEEAIDEMMIPFKDSIGVNSIFQKSLANGVTSYSVEQEFPVTFMILR